MMKTAKLVAINFKIICPSCEEAVEREDRPGVVMFGAENVRPGAIMTCTNEKCKKPFRLPNTPKAEVK